MTLQSSLFCGPCDTVPLVSDSAIEEDDQSSCESQMVRRVVLASFLINDSFEEPLLGQVVLSGE